MKSHRPAEGDWRLGDWALCVKSGPWHRVGEGPRADGPTRGQVFAVAGIVDDSGVTASMFLRFDLWPEDQWDVSGFMRLREQAVMELDDYETVCAMMGVAVPGLRGWKRR